MALSVTKVFQFAYTSAGAGVTGKSSSITVTVYQHSNATSSASTKITTGIGSVTEVNSTDQPGLYKVGVSGLNPTYAYTVVATYTGTSTDVDAVNKYALWDEFSMTAAGGAIPQVAATSGPILTAGTGANQLQVDGYGNGYVGGFSDAAFQQFAGPGNIWYVSKSGSDSYTGLQPTAGGSFLTIGQALSVAGNGDTIIVSAGNYAEALTVAVNVKIILLLGAFVQAPTAAPTLSILNGLTVAVSGLGILQINSGTNVLAANGGTFLATGITFVMNNIEHAAAVFHGGDNNFTVLTGVIVFDISTSSNTLDTFAYNSNPGEFNFSGVTLQYDDGTSTLVNGTPNNIPDRSRGVWLQDADVLEIDDETANAAGAVTFPSSIGTSSYAGEDTAGTTTLLSRVPQTLLFDGSGYIKSDPQTEVTVSTGSIASIQSGLATASSQGTTNAALAAIMGGSFDPDTDNLHAIAGNAAAAAQGGGGGGGGTGAYTYTITVESGSTLIQNAIVSLTLSGLTQTYTTNSSGVVTASLGAGTWTVSIFYPGYQFTPTTLVVSANGSQTYNITANTISPPAGPSYATGVLQVNPAVAGTPIYIQMVKPPRGDGPTDGYGWSFASVEVTSNSSGVVQYTGFVQGGTYRARWDVEGPWSDEFTVPIAASFNIAEVTSLPSNP